MNPIKLPLFLLLLPLLSSTNSYHITLQPCKTLTFFFHDIHFNGDNSYNATAAIVAAPAWANRTKLAGLNHFGDVVVFDDPITLNNDLHSPAIGRAQGLYLYDRKDVFTAWLAFSFVFNSTEHRGTIQFAGADPLMNKTREVSVVGGTGDFFLTRGVATLMTDAFEGEVYFRLKVDIRLYDVRELSDPLDLAPFFSRPLDGLPWIVFFFASCLSRLIDLRYLLPLDRFLDQTVSLPSNLSGLQLLERARLDLWMRSDPWIKKSATDLDRWMSL